MKARRVTVFTNGIAILPDRLLPDAVVVCDKGKIAAVGSAAITPATRPTTTIGSLRMTLPPWFRAVIAPSLRADVRHAIPVASVPCHPRDGPVKFARTVFRGRSARSCN